MFVPISIALAQPRRRKRFTGSTRKVYALVDPAGRARYVGVTRRTLPIRLGLHLEHPTNAHTAAWFDELRRDGIVPAIVLLEHVSEAEWEDAERGWIAWFRQRGELLNVDRGGQARNDAGRLRPFVASPYKPPVSNPRTSPGRRASAFTRAALPMPKVIPTMPIKAPVAERVGKAVYIRRPSQRAVKDD